MRAKFDPPHRTDASSVVSKLNIIHFITEESFKDRELIRMDIVWHQLEVNNNAVRFKKQQHPCVIWFAGLSSSGKSIIAGDFEQKPNALSHYSYLYLSC